MIRSAIFLFFILSFNLNLIYAQDKAKIEPKREFRGVWVATVENIDWPSKAGLTMDQQKQEFIGILERHKANGINAIMFQVRPAADAFYAKSREPWSRWLMGKQGLPPAPGYDPLEFAIDEAHSRGMELHAWFNPYRASTHVNHVLVEDHITKQKPEWFFSYGGKKQFNPGIPEVREYIIQVILDVVKGYNVDGIHFDDYFYPYPIAGQKINDEGTYVKYKGNFTNIGDWRRNNVNLLVKELGDSIHYYKKHVKFGLSPSAIWRNIGEDKEGAKTAGLSTYSTLYADSRKWIKEGWVDYINPQIYFSFTRKVAPFPVLADWWSDNTYGRHLYIGHGLYLVHNGTTKAEAAWALPSQIPDQIRYIRKNENIHGSIYFSSKSFTTVGRKVADSLKNDFYKYPSLPPQMPWLDDIKPNSPKNFNAEVKSDGVHLKWEKPDKATDGETASGYVIYRFEEGEQIDISNARNILKIRFQEFTTFLDTEIEKNKRYSYVITALDRLKNESIPSNIEGILTK
ncbi:glycoside hydrolase family 10 protein [Pedobacter flavus]|uniref:Family 10 glycosylhydrolase n=1 Tax=Pedobacter flavus TaxID=3113906 RepID=A0ABU7GZX0_9SPHI|nr:family 10 glycosylhydrolase [Pedobacter sp. VNH31]MEE1884602.1 family 10 glycosylhydrolase [Pedobacter sp. VNH31]